MKNETEGMNRRRFLGNGGASLLGVTMPGMLRASVPERKEARAESEKHFFSSKQGSYKDMVREAVQYQKIDVHNHTHFGDLADMIESMDRLGIQWAAASDRPSDDTHESFRKCNDVVLDAIKQYPNRILGQCRINPGYPRETLLEIDRCVDKGMVMLGELYDQYKINDPVYYPIIERCIEHKIPLLVHGAAPLGLWREGYPTVGSSLTTSTAEDFMDIGQRYPEALIICGHIGGGGDWEYACKVLREAPSIYADTSGSVVDEAMIDLAIENIGVDRLLFATDGNYETSVGKVMYAKLTENERKKIFFDNFNNILRKGGNNVN